MFSQFEVINGDNAMASGYEHKPKNANVTYVATGHIPPCINVQVALWLEGSWLNTIVVG